ncbi:MAG: magnesium transporter [Sedimentisphaerales bacterium]|nr:magnesium transporter [Sedimentisphaerales bacterium]
MAEEKKQLLRQIEPLLEADDKQALRALLDDSRSSNIAEVVEILDEQGRRSVFDVLDRETSAEVLEKVDEATRSNLFELLKDHELRAIILELDLDDAADLLAELPEEECQGLLSEISPAIATKIRKLMSYSEDSAGGIMDPVLMSVTEDATVAEAVSKIRSAEIDEDFYSIFVVDSNSKFLGDVRIRHLLTAPESRKIKELLEEDTIYVNADADQEEVRNIFRNNDLIVIPVLDNQRRLIGRITADRIIEVAEEEAAEDLYAMAGTEPEELEDFRAFHAARIRMTWLLPCLLGTSVTALIMTFFKSHEPLVYLTAAAFVPMIAAISGNAGLQTSAIVVSGLATGHLAALKFSQVFSRETRIALLVALACGVLGGIACSIMLNFRTSESESIQITRLVLAFGTAMFSAIMVATTLGLVLPFLFRKIGIDPAISSGPLVTTANDSISVAIYLTLTLALAG